MAYVGSLDQGTSSTRFIIFNHDGKIVSSAQEAHEQILPSPGWVEHDAAEIWKRCQSVITKALASAGIQSSQLAAIGITNQRETTLAWNVTTGLPLANAIVWQDMRTSQYCSEIRESDQELLTKRTGLPVAPYFSASKIHWLINNVPRVSEAIARGDARFGTIDSWILWNLSGGINGGVHFTDVTNASRTLLMDLETLDWDLELLKIFEIPPGILPEIHSSSEIYAHTQANGFLGAQIPIAAILGDQQAAMVGQACFDSGDSKTTYGTGNFALLNTGEEIVHSQHGLLTTVLYKFGNAPAHYALEGSVAVTGSAVQWLRDQLGIINEASEIEALAASVDNSGGVYFVPAFSGLFAPHWRSDARGVIVGLTRASTKAHIARATLESICYQTKEILDSMVADSGRSLTFMRVDGGITANELCMQLQSDILGITIKRPTIIETTAVGAAYAAGLAVGYWEDIDELKKHWSISKEWNPIMNANTRTEGFRLWKKAVARTLNWVE
ncbi:MAG: glycerol kinase [Streptomycetaceae bacterium]|nr:MAG: glycerol kinase [Streptomycetaceae bacterium]